MARQMETRRCAVCGEPFQAAVEGHRTRCAKHKGRTRRQAFQSRGAKYERARPGERCTIGPSATTGERCGRPGVVAFHSSAGHRYVECERHAPATALAQVGLR